MYITTYTEHKYVNNLHNIVIIPCLLSWWFLLFPANHSGKYII